MSAGCTDAEPRRSVENTDDGRYVFARLHQQTVGITTRLNYTVAKAVDQLYAEPFVSAGDY